MVIFIFAAIVTPVVTGAAHIRPTRCPLRTGPLCIIRTIVTVLTDEKRISPRRSIAVPIRIRATWTAGRRCPA